MPLPVRLRAPLCPVVLSLSSRTDVMFNYGLCWCVAMSVGRPGVSALLWMFHNYGLDSAHRLVSAFSCCLWEHARHILRQVPKSDHSKPACGTCFFSLNELTSCLRRRSRQARAASQRRLCKRCTRRCCCLLCVEVSKHYQ